MSKGVAASGCFWEIAGQHVNALEGRIGSPLGQHANVGGLLTAVRSRPDNARRFGSDYFECRYIVGGRDEGYQRMSGDSSAVSPSGTGIGPEYVKTAVSFSSLSALRGIIAVIRLTPGLTCFTLCKGKPK